MIYKIVGNLSFMGFNVEDVVIDVEAEGIKEAFKEFDKYFRHRKIKDFIHDDCGWGWLKEHSESASVMSTLKVKKYETEKPLNEPTFEKGQDIVDILKEPTPEKRLTPKAATKKEVIQEVNDILEIELDGETQIEAEAQVIPPKELRMLWDKVPDVDFFFSKEEHKRMSKKRAITMSGILM